MPTAEKTPVTFTIRIEFDADKRWSWYVSTEGAKTVGYGQAMTKAEATREAKAAADAYASVKQPRVEFSYTTEGKA